MADRLQHRELRQLPRYLRRERLVQDHDTNDKGDDQSRSEIQAGAGLRCPERDLVGGQLGARENLRVVGQNLAKRLRHLVGVGARVQRDEPEIDRIARSRARAGAENPEKRILARQHDSKPEKPGASV